MHYTTCAPSLGLAPYTSIALFVAAVSHPAQRKLRSFYGLLNSCIVSDSCCARCAGTLTGGRLGKKQKAISTLHAKKNEPNRNPSASAPVRPSTQPSTTSCLLEQTSRAGGESLQHTRKQLNTCPPHCRPGWVDWQALARTLLPAQQQRNRANWFFILSGNFGDLGTSCKIEDLKEEAQPSMLSSPKKSIGQS
jgi:hypothetical protein